MSDPAQLIREIERLFEELRKEYTLFLSDVSHIEPTELRDALVKKMQRLRNTINMRTEEEFRTSNLNAKLQSHIQLWNRQVERKFQGKLYTPLTGKPKKRAPKPTKTPPDRAVVIGDPNRDRAHIVSLYDEYMRLNLLVGSRKMANFTKFQSFITQQTHKIQQARGVDRVRYEVTVKDQKVVIKSKSIQNKNT